MTRKYKIKKQRIDDSIAMDRLALMRYFASGLIAGGAGVILTMLLGTVTIHPQSYIVLGCLDVFMTAGCVYCFYTGIKWMGVPASRKLELFTLFGLSYMLLNTIFSRPAHDVLAFTGFWWSLIVKAFITIIIGATFRYLAEINIDDLQYGFDHDMATVTDIREVMAEETKAKKKKSE